MKKLTKKSLDELAAVMPIINEKNQQECVGGHYFVGGTGDYLGSNNVDCTTTGLGITDMIFVVTGIDLVNFRAAENSGQLSTFSGGTSLANFDQFTEQQICNVYKGMFSGSVSGFNPWNYEASYINCFDSTQDSYSFSLDSNNKLVFDFGEYGLTFPSGIAFAGGVQTAWQNFADEIASGIV